MTGSMVGAGSVGMTGAVSSGTASVVGAASSATVVAVPSPSAADVAGASVSGVAVAGVVAAGGVESAPPTESSSFLFEQAAAISTKPIATAATRRPRRRMDGCV